MTRTKGVMQPIRKSEKIEEMKNFILRRDGYKYFFLFSLGLNTGLRISDILKLRVRDVRDKDTLTIITTKTKRELIVPLNPTARDGIKKYIKDLEDDQYLFFSRVGENRPVTPQYVSKVITRAAEHCGLEKVNTHTMRKTFGYHYYKKTKDVYTLMKIFGHTEPAETKKYISIELDEIAQSLEDFGL